MPRLGVSVYRAGLYGGHGDGRGMAAIVVPAGGDELYWCLPQSVQAPEDVRPVCREVETGNIAFGVPDYRYCYYIVRGRHDNHTPMCCNREQGGGMQGAGGMHGVLTMVSVCLAAQALWAQPSAVSMVLLTPDSLRIAGDTLHAAVHIRNENGAVPGKYCFGPDTSPKARYFDPALHLPGQPSPVVLTDEDTATINRLFTDGSDSLTQCFEDGADTIGVVLYCAPAANAGAEHQLWVELGGLINYTERFTLHPGPVASLRLTFDEAGTMPAPDTLLIGNDASPIVLYSQGYDAWGNERGLSPSAWSADGTIASVAPTIRSSITVDSATTALAGEGTITATAIDAPVHASVYLIIEKPQARLLRAATRDTNGNGLLDRMVLAMDGAIDLSGIDARVLRDSIAVAWNTHTWRVAAVSAASGGSTDSVLQADLVEGAADLPQTGIRPSVRIRGISGIQDMTTAVASVDGAGPVVWWAGYTPDCDEGCEGTVVRVQMSENVATPTGNLTPFVSPDELFKVYIHTDSGTYEPVHGLLSGIDGLICVSDSSFSGVTATVVQFGMSNAQCIMTYHHLAFDGDSPVTVADLAAPEANVPPANQVPAQVEWLDPNCPDTDTTTSAPEGTGCGDCGTGVQQAMIPLLWVAGQSWWRRRRRRRKRGAGPR